MTDAGWSRPIIEQANGDKVEASRGREIQAIIMEEEVNKRANMLQL